MSKRYIKFRSSDKKVVTVDKNGKLKAKKAGIARITVTVSRKGYKKKSAWVRVSVSEKKNATTKRTSSTPAAPSNKPAEKPDGTDQDSKDASKLLVAYFSWSGTSERIAQNIISQTGADSFRIECETPYSTDYNEVAYGDAQQEAENNARPPIKNPLSSVAQYDKIIVCYPIWWHTAPMTVGTFLERYDLTGKKIYPISQSASMDVSQYQQSVVFIGECAKGAAVDNGLFTKDNAAIRSYVENIVLK